ncbi:hypothetical protein [Streptomyces sp. NPDC005784]|uniref:hypothetical protein n=1 Tax=Streptomyces sp. NPDC005784 TaxID=3364731 RepID=UPI00367D3B9C
MPNEVLRSPVRGQRRIIGHPATGDRDRRSARGSTGDSEYAIDAAFAVIARNAHQPVTALTSAPEDLTLLCGPSVEVVKV